jgi:hypothetical protein
VGMVMDPHIKRWDHKWFGKIAARTTFAVIPISCCLTWANMFHLFLFTDYHGECDLVLIHAPDFHDRLGLRIHVRTTIRWNYSFISSAAIKIGSDVLEVASWGDYFWNGVSGGELPALGPGKEVAINVTQSPKISVFNIVMDESEESIEVKTFKDFVSVKLQHGTMESFATSVGMMGSFGDVEGQMLARDGNTVLEDPLAFGQEWQVTNTEPMLFQAVRSPQFPQECILPNPAAKDKIRRLGMSTVDQATAERACAQWGHGSMMQCVQDVMMAGDLDMAQEGLY